LRWGPGNDEGINWKILGDGEHITREPSLVQILDREPVPSGNLFPPAVAATSSVPLTDE
jgi:hypothetical protein